MKNNTNYQHSELTSEIIKSAYYVHDYLGFGFLESVYERALEVRLLQQGYNVKRQYPIKVYFECEEVGDFKADLIVNDLIIVELKAVGNIHTKHEVQLVNYLKSTEIEVGLLINFGEELRVKRRVFSNNQKRKGNRIPGSF
ncbi:MAG: GxxExxY protein [Saprospiraceae bacterium]